MNAAEKIRPTAYGRASTQIANTDPAGGNVSSLETLGPRTYRMALGGRLVRQRAPPARVVHGETRGARLQPAAAATYWVLSPESQGLSSRRAVPLTH